MGEVLVSEWLSLTVGVVREWLSSVVCGVVGGSVYMYVDGGEVRCVSGGGGLRLRSRSCDRTNWPLAWRQQSTDYTSLVLRS